MVGTEKSEVNGLISNWLKKFMTLGHTLPVF
jgi:hypothetical protein